MVRQHPRLPCLHHAGQASRASHDARAIHTNDRLSDHLDPRLAQARIDLRLGNRPILPFIAEETH